MAGIYERQWQTEEEKRRKEERALNNAQGLITKSVLFDPAEHIGNAAETVKKKNLQKLEKKYDIDASTFGRDEFVNWAEKHHFKEPFIDAFGGATYYPKGQLEIGPFIKIGKKQTTKDEEADAEVLSQIAGNNERRKTAQGVDSMDNFDGVTMAALAGFGDGLSLGFASKTEDSKKKKAYLAAGLPESEYVSVKNDIYEKNNKKHPIANLAGDIGGSTLAFGAVKEGVAAIGAAGVKAAKAVTGIQKVERAAETATNAAQIGGTVSKATKGVEWISKNHEWVQNALELGVTNAVVSGARIAANDGDTKAVAQGSAAGFAGSLVGSAASKAVGQIGANILFDKGQRDALISNIILGGATSASYAAGQTGVSYLLYPEGYKPQKKDIARDMAVAFAIGAISYSYNTAKISNESRQYLENVKDRISDDYEAISKCYAEALMNSRDPKEALGSMEDYAQNIRKYNEDVKSFITRRDVQFVGQKKYVDNILEALEEVSQAANGKLYEFSEWVNSRNASSGSGSSSSGAASSGGASSALAAIGAPQIPSTAGPKAQASQPVPISPSTLSGANKAAPAIPKLTPQASLSNEERTEINRVARVVGTKVKMAEQGKATAAKDKYEHGIVYLPENADDPMKKVFAHKMMRHMKENSPNTYSRYVRAVMDKLSDETGLKRSELMQHMGRRYAEQGIELTIPGAADELVADFNMRVLNDPNELTELVRNIDNLNDLQKRSIVSRVTNPIRAITNRFDNYERLTGRRIAPGEVAGLRSIQQQLENIVAEKAWNLESRAGAPDSGLYSALEDAGSAYAMAGTDHRALEDGRPKLSSPLTDVEAVVAPQRSGVDNSGKSGIIITDEQFGKKVGRHAKDWGLDPGNVDDRVKIEGIIDDIYYNHDVPIRIGPWRGQNDDVLFYIKGEDVVITKQNGEFVTVMKGGISNVRVKNARKR